MGRYQSLLIEDGAALARVVDYIHLNPVRAKIISAEQVRHFRWSSLAGIVRGDGWTDDRGWRGDGRFGADDSARKSYERALVELGRDEAHWETLGLKNLSVGWAIGSSGWRRSLAKEFRQLALQPGLEHADVHELRESAWEGALQGALTQAKRTEDELGTAPRMQPWKATLAALVRQETGAPIAWLARRLQLGAPASLRSYFHRNSIPSMQRATA